MNHCAKHFSHFFLQILFPHLILTNHVHFYPNRPRNDKVIKKKHIKNHQKVKFEPLCQKNCKKMFIFSFLTLNYVKLSIFIKIETVMVELWRKIKKCLYELSKVCQKWAILAKFWVPRSYLSYKKVHKSFRNPSLFKKVYIRWFEWKRNVIQGRR